MNAGAFMMLEPQDAQIARLLKQRIQTISQIEKMIVFGSRARGDADAESDMDVFIEVPILTPSIHQQILETAWEIGLDNGLVISPFLASTSLLTNGPLAGNPILRVIQSEGVAV